MSSHTVIWSAATCHARSAGVYLGLAPQYEHMIVARALSRRQAKLFIGGHVHVSGEARPWRLYYYAVRDPSAVRILPSHDGGLPGGYRPAELRFRFSPGVDEAVVGPARRTTGPSGPAPAAFVLTIGLDGGSERTFFQRALGDEPSAWSEIFDRVRRHFAGAAA